MARPDPRNRGRLRRAAPSQSTGMDPEDQHYQDVARRRGHQVAQAIAGIADRSPIANVSRAWVWAEEQFDLAEASSAHGCGYDPTEPGGG